MRLNKKGYLLVEVIISSVLALILAYFLIDITVDLKNRNSDNYIDTVLATDKALITKEVMNDINNYELVGVAKIGDYQVNLTFYDEEADAQFSKSLTIDANSRIVSYGNFSKQLAEELNVNELTVTCETGNTNCANSNGILYINLSANTNYSKVDYGINLLIPYNGKTVISFPEGGSNHPMLPGGMVAVYYDETSNVWKKADTTNLNPSYQWYDYENKKWANAILLSSGSRDAYMANAPGTTILDSDILGYYVWIPRYKYKVWNINKVVNVDSYNALTVGIDIVFETGTNSTGTIDCTTTPYSFANPSSSVPNETCVGANGDYFTHPAFAFGGKQLTGFWVGKFETTGDSATPTVLPNSRPIIPNNISTPFNISQMFDSSRYLTSAGVIQTDAHLMRNMEWGAVVYLINSKYGRCVNNVCTEVDSNFGRNTGGNNYQVNTNQAATSNIYGIYDLSGGTTEIVMGNMSSGSGSYTFYPSSSGFSIDWYSTIDNQKYLDTYAYGKSSTDQTAFNRSRLGDAMGEVMIRTGNRGAWYGDSSNFCSGKTPWFSRGYFSGPSTSRGIFSFSCTTGTTSNQYSFRSVLSQ